MIIVFNPEGYISDWGMKMQWAHEAVTFLDDVKHDAICYLHNNFEYRLEIPSGCVTKGESDNSIILRPGKEGIIMRFNQGDKK